MVRTIATLLTVMAVGAFGQVDAGRDEDPGTPPDDCRRSPGGALEWVGSLGTPGVKRADSQWGVSALSAARDGKALAVLTHRHGAAVWDVDHRTSTVAAPRAHHGLALAPDGKRMVVGTKENALLLWDVEGGAELGTWTGHKQYVTAIGWSPDGSRVFSADSGGTLKLWNAEEGREEASVDVPGDDGAWAFLPDGKHLLTGGERLTLREVPTLKEVADLGPDGGRGVDTNLWAIVVDSSAQRALAWAWYQPIEEYARGRVLSYDIAGKRLLEIWANLDGGRGFVAAGVAFAPSGDRGLCLAGGRLVVFDLEKGAEVDAVRLHLLPNCMASAGDLVFVGTERSVVLTYRIK